MQAADRLAAVEIGERARDPQHAMIAARRQAHGLGGIAQQFGALRVGLRDGLQHRGRCFGIGADPRQSARRVARPLDIARRGDARGDDRLVAIEVAERSLELWTELTSSKAT
jgi:hypothetical protein